MLVTHLIIGARVTVKAAIHVLSILHLPQAIDCGGGLVNALGSWLPCRGKNVCLYFYGQTWMGSFCYKTTGTWVRWNSASGVISFSPNSLYSSHRKGDHWKWPVDQAHAYCIRWDYTNQGSGWDWASCQQYRRVSRFWAGSGATCDPGGCLLLRRLACFVGGWSALWSTSCRFLLYVLRHVNFVAPCNISKQVLISRVLLTPHARLLLLVPSDLL